MKILLCLLLSLCLTNVYADQAFAQREDVQKFIQHMHDKYGFDKAKLTKTFEAVTPRPQVMKSIKHPAEANPWDIYQHLFITDTKIQHGIEFWNTNAEVLAKAAKEFQVPEKIIVATIGVETNYGTNLGKFRVIDALADITFNYPARSKFFSYELEQFFLMAREDNLDPLTVMGSYAGAIGQPQFMPDSFRKFAVDYSGNGKIDINTDIDDVIGSIANYYHKHGWRMGENVVLPVTIKDQKQVDELTPNSLSHLYTIEQLKAHGIEPQGKLPKQEKDFLLIKLESKDGNQYMLGLHDFVVIMHYNSSPLYAMAVVDLGNKIETNR